MSETEFKLAKAPIVEAVVDIDCDMPPGFDLAALEGAARERFLSEYSKQRAQLISEAKIEAEADQKPLMSFRHAIQAFQFLQADEKQLVQVRARGFSFNRLAPYTTLDDYLPEIERTWELFVGLVLPVQIRAVRLRYVNRIMLPFAGGRVDLDDYIKLGPRLPDEEKLLLGGFLNQYIAVETDTKNQVNIVLTAQPPENEKLPIIFDISALSEGTVEPDDWESVRARITSLRTLKNRIFRNTLTDQCLNLFQQ